MKKLVLVSLLVVLAVTSAAAVEIDPELYDLWRTSAGLPTGNATQSKTPTTKKTPTQKTTAKKKTATKKKSSGSSSKSSSPKAATSSKSAPAPSGEAQLIINSFSGYAAVEKINNWWVYVHPLQNIGVDPYFYVYLAGSSARDRSGIMYAGATYVVTTQKITSLRSSDIRWLITMLQIPGTEIEWFSGTAARLFAAPWQVQGVVNKVITDVHFGSAQPQPAGALIEGEVSIFRRN